MISAIFAVDNENGIGNQGSMPWPINKEDLKWFKTTTENQIVVMGKKTWDSSDMPKPLPNRINVVFSNTFLDNQKIIQMRGDVCEGIRWLEEKYPDKNIFIIGGANILMQAKPIIHQAYITRIKNSYICDTKIDLASFINGFTLDTSTIYETCKVEKYII